MVFETYLICHRCTKTFKSDTPAKELRDHMTLHFDVAFVEKEFTLRRFDKDMLSES